MALYSTTTDYSTDPFAEMFLNGDMIKTENVHETSPGKFWEKKK